jgi:hypothetical protein
MRQNLIEQATEAYRNDDVPADVFDALIDQLTEQEWLYVKGVVDDEEDEFDVACDVWEQDCEARLGSVFEALLDASQ